MPEGYILWYSISIDVVVSKALANTLLFSLYLILLMIALYSNRFIDYYRAIIGELREKITKSIGLGPWNHHIY